MKKNKKQVLSKRNSFLVVASTVISGISPFVRKSIVAGSIRREKEFPDDIDVLIIMKKKFNLYDIRNFVVENFNATINWSGYNKMQAVIYDIKVDFKVTTYQEWGAALLYFTGSGEFNMRMRAIAKSKGLKLNEYGLWRNENEIIESKDERKIFKALEMNYLEPNKRA